MLRAGETDGLQANKAIKQNILVMKEHDKLENMFETLDNIRDEHGDARSMPKVLVFTSRKVIILLSCVYYFTSYVVTFVRSCIFRCNVKISYMLYWKKGIKQMHCMVIRANNLVLALWIGFVKEN